MASILAQYAATGPHLDLLCSVPIEGGDQLVIHRDHAFVSARYGGSHTLSIIDVSNPAEAVVSQTMQFKGSIASVVMHGDILLAAETGRALNFIDVSAPKNPNYFNCALTLGQDLYDVALIGDLAVLGLRWEGVGLVDLQDPEHARLGQKVKLDDGFVERLVVAADHIFVAGANGGLRLFGVDDRVLVERTRLTEPDLNIHSVFNVGDEVWAVGTGDKSSTLVVVDPAHPTKIARTFPFECSWPRTLFPLIGGGAIGFHEHYTCLGYDPAAGWAGELFKQYTVAEDGNYREIPCKLDNDGAYWDRKLSCMGGVSQATVQGEFLFATQGKQFNVYRLTEDSVFRQGRAPCL